VAHVEYIPCCTDQSCPKCKTATPPAAQLEQKKDWQYVQQLNAFSYPSQWVGLTEQEIKSLPSWWPSYEDAPALVQLVKDVEAKLREKNGE
jgi:ABC-type Zn uptake system ZnuABC Zn-binding protein ZnuA